METLKARCTQARMFVTVAEVEARLLAPLLPQPLTPRRLFGTTSGLSLQFLEVGDSPVGPYFECTLSILCKETFDWPTIRTKGFRSLLGFPIWIAVTSAAAERYGREVWAYPKHVGNLRFAFDARRFEGSAAAAGVTVTCSADLGVDREPTDVEFRSLSRRDGDLLCAPMTGRADLTLDWDPSAAFALDLEPLGLGRLEGTASTGIYADHFTFELFPPTPRPLSSLAVPVRTSTSELDPRTRRPT